MTSVDEIRKFVHENYIQPAKEQGETQITIVAGDVHAKMGLKNRVPAVCNALRSEELRRMCKVRLINEVRRHSVKRDSSTNRFVFDLKDIEGPPFIGEVKEALPKDIIEVKEREKPSAGREERINFLKKKENFEKCIAAFYKNCPFSQEQFECHKRVIEKLRSCKPEKREKLFTNDDFLWSVYEVVKKWAELRRAKLVKFEVFRNEIKNNSLIISKLVRYKLNEVNEEKWGEIRGELKALFKNLKIMEGKSQLVGVSKTLHHLLPDLVPPIDREYIQRFYGYSAPDWKEADMFLNILDMFYSICKDLGLTENYFVREWDTSIPKLIDNAIVGYFRQKR